MIFIIFASDLSHCYSIATISHGINAEHNRDASAITHKTKLIKIQLTQKLNNANNRYLWLAILCYLRFCITYLVFLHFLCYCIFLGFVLFFLTELLHILCHCVFALFVFGIIALFGLFAFFAFMMSFAFLFLCFLQIMHQNTIMQITQNAITQNANNAIMQNAITQKCKHKRDTKRDTRESLPWSH